MIDFVDTSLLYLSGTLILTLITGYLAHQSKEKFLAVFTIYWGLLSLNYISLYYIALTETLWLLNIYAMGLSLAILTFFLGSLILHQRPLTQTLKTLLLGSVGFVVILTSVAFIAIEFIIGILLISSVYFIWGSLLFLKSPKVLHKTAGFFALFTALNYTIYPLLAERPWYHPYGYLITGMIGLLFGLSIVGIHINNEFSKHSFIQQELYHKSFHDSLTKIHNRAYYDEQLKIFTQSCVHPISLLVLDLNNLKRINDQYGHRTGDEVIIKTAELLMQTCEKDMIITRYGGDEFVVFLPGYDYLQAKDLKHKIHLKAKETKIKDISIDLAIGFASAATKDDSLTKLFDDAEHMMYQQKKAK